MKTLTILGCIWLMALGGAYAQYDPIYYQYQFNTLAINPAYAGSRDVLSSVFISRNQWVGFEGAPTTQSFSVHSPVVNDYTSLGMTLTHDKTGPMSQTIVFGDYAFRFNVSPLAKLALGLNGGFNQIKIDYNSLVQMPGQPDAAYDQGILSKTMPNFGFGLYLSHPRYYMGLSAPRLIENDFTSSESGSAVLQGGEERAYYLMGGAIFTLSEHLKLKPSIMMRYTTAAPISTDINANLLMYEKLWTGVMFRPESAWGAMVQYQVSPQFKFGYAIEFTTNELQSASNGTHEFLLMYEFNYKKQKVYSPRYF
jgi:type IX secretion system PorP/SprF family membrane protein